MYEATYTTEYKLNLSILKDQEATIHWRSIKKGHISTIMSSSAFHNSLSNQIVASYIWLSWYVLRPKNRLTIPIQDRRNESKRLRNTLSWDISSRVWKFPKYSRVSSDYTLIITDSTFHKFIVFFKNYIVFTFLIDLSKYCKQVINFNLY